MSPGPGAQSTADWGGQTSGVLETLDHIDKGLAYFILVIVALAVGAAFMYFAGRLKNRLRIARIEKGITADPRDAASKPVSHDGLLQAINETKEALMQGLLEAERRLNAEVNVVREQLHGRISKAEDTLEGRIRGVELEIARGGRRE